MNHKQKMKERRAIIRYLDENSHISNDLILNCKGQFLDAQHKYIGGERGSPCLKPLLGLNLSCFFPIPLKRK